MRARGYHVTSRNTSLKNLGKQTTGSLGAPTVAAPLCRGETAAKCRGYHKRGNDRARYQRCHSERSEESLIRYRITEATFGYHICVGWITRSEPDWRCIRDFV